MNRKTNNIPLVARKTRLNLNDDLKLGMTRKLSLGSTHQSGKMHRVSPGRDIPKQIMKAKKYSQIKYWVEIEKTIDSLGKFGHGTRDRGVRLAKLHVYTPSRRQSGVQSSRSKSRNKSRNSRHEGYVIDENGTARGLNKQPTELILNKTERVSPPVPLSRMASEEKISIMKDS